MSTDKSDVQVPSKEDLRNEITQKHTLNKTVVVEKNILPTEADLRMERAVEKASAITKQIEENPDLIKKLHRVEAPQVKNVLPTKEQIEAEKKLIEETKKD